MFRFETLDVWKRSIEITDTLFDLADELEAKKRFRFAEQLRGAVLSVSNNIAEGSGSSSRNEFKQFLNYSHRSVFESANMIIICHRRSYLDELKRQQHLADLEQISKMIIGFSRSL
mgnify:FL=1